MQLAQTMRVSVEIVAFLAQNICVSVQIVARLCGFQLWSMKLAQTLFISVEIVAIGLGSVYFS